MIFEDMNYKSDQPIETMWGELLKLSDIFYLSRIWIYPDIKDTDYEYVSTSIMQAYEYFKASKTTSLQTRPLMLYYSFLNLTKAILFIKNNQKPNDKHHGLCRSANNISDNLLDYKVKINGGIFSDLSKLIGFSIQNKQEVSFQDFCDNSIELNKFYADYFNITRTIITAKITPFQANYIWLFIDKQYESAVQANTTIFEDFRTMDENNKIFLTLMAPYNWDQEEILIKKHLFSSILPDDKYYININPQDKRMPNILTYYGLIFILGDIVRYKPEYLYKLLNDKNESNKWFINKVCDIGERVYPNLLLNMISPREIKFSHY